MRRWMLRRLTRWLLDPRNKIVVRDATGRKYGIVDYWYYDPAGDQYVVYFKDDPASIQPELQ